jgi:hypothetical protein
MPLPGRIFLFLFAMAVLVGLMLDNPRPLAVRPPTHLGTATVDQPLIELPS